MKYIMSIIAYKLTYFNSWKEKKDVPLLNYNLLSVQNIVYYPMVDNKLNYLRKGLHNSYFNEIFDSFQPCISFYP